MPTAIHVREDNILYIRDVAVAHGMNLSYIKDTMEYNREDGFETYVVFDYNPAIPSATFTEFIEDDFRRNWKFIEQENPNMFVKIERV